jgi:hypothetical protein
MSARTCPGPTEGTLRIVDDVALTTGAPTMASFSYWRMVSQKSRDAPCPCRSGKKAKRCSHTWADEPPLVTERFRLSDPVSQEAEKDG